ncbi:hypothetical protein N7523_007376 [Penicillium sp. IBT 18751x]|nr:hypothetical protein N7523_007376 [Penicillium sp. IBT 18751x]
MAPATRSAARKAFTVSTLTPPALETPEVLEMILLQTDMRTLLTSCQRVCRDWRNLIIKSPSIQKALFFISIKESEWGAGEKVPNPLLAEMFPTIFPTKGDPDNRDFHFFDCAMTKDPASLDRFVWKDASWRRMLVQQPPISELGLFHIDSARGGDSAHCISIAVSLAINLRLEISRLTRHIQANPKTQANGDEGLRMGMLFEILLFDSPIRIGTSRRARLFWSADEPIDFHSSCELNKDAFHRMLRQFDLVLYNTQVIQCGMGFWGDFSAGKTTRMDIIEAYREHGLDIDSQAEEMKAYRRSAKEIEWAGIDSVSDEGESEELSES